MKPFRITFNGVSPVSDEKLQANVRANTAPFAQMAPPNGRILAVVGGGNSSRDCLEELKAWPGDIWAINATCAWLKTQGVNSVLFTVDPYETSNEVLDELVNGVESALLSTSCNPKIFARLKNVKVFHTHGKEDEGLFIAGGSTSACIAGNLALKLGYRSITYFGCEGSWQMDQWSHCDRNEKGDQLVIKAGGADYITNPQMMLQSEQLSNALRMFTDFYHERSGGLLRAMIENPETWEVVALSGSLRATLDPDGDVIPYVLKEAA